MYGETRPWKDRGYQITTTKFSHLLKVLAIFWCVWNKWTLKTLLKHMWVNMEWIKLEKSKYHGGRHLDSGRNLVPFHIKLVVIRYLHQDRFVLYFCSFLGCLHMKTGCRTRFLILLWSFQCITPYDPKCLLFQLFYKKSNHSWWSELGSNGRNMVPSLQFLSFVKHDMRSHYQSW